MNGIHIIGDEAERWIVDPCIKPASRGFFRSRIHLVVQVGEIGNQSLMVIHRHGSNFNEI